MYSCKSLETGDLLLALPLILAGTASQCGVARQEQIRPWQEGTPLLCIYISYVHLHGGDWP